VVLPWLLAGWLAGFLAGSNERKKLAAEKKGD